MNERSHATQRCRRDPEPITVVRDQRTRSNEFAQDVWQMVPGRRCRGQKFRREHPIPPYTADFCCVALKLIIEVDGQHDRSEAGQQRDARRDDFLAERGYTVLRISGYDVLRDAVGVRRLIEQTIDQHRPSSQTSLGERGARLKSWQALQRHEPKNPRRNTGFIDRSVEAASDALRKTLT